MTRSMTSRPSLMMTSIGLVACVSVALSACSSSSASNKVSADSSGCIAEGAFDSNKDYFPEKVSFDHAKGVSVEYRKSYKVVTVKNPSSVSTKPARYVLVQCGAPAPELTGDLAGATKVTIPVKRVALGSTTTPAKFAMLDNENAIIGTANPQKIWNEKIEALVKAGKIKNFAQNQGSTEVDNEVLVSLRPDLFIISGHYDPSKFSKLTELSIPVVAEGDYLEQTPLGRSEWIKYDSMFVNAEAKANQVFSDIEKRYKEVADKAAKASGRPTVFYGYQMKGVWYIKPTENYSIQFLRDAGADYVFNDVHGVSTAKMNTEQILAKAATAEFWIDGGLYGGFSTIEGAIASDSRLSSLASVQKGNVWNATIRTSKEKGNDFFQLGLLRPDLVLGDLVGIVHPEIADKHDFTFYQKAPAK